MDPVTIATAVIPAILPVVIKCGGMVLKRYFPEMATDVTEEKLAAIGGKASGGGVLVRIGEIVGRFFGRDAGVVVEDQARPVLIGGVDGFMVKAGEKLLNAAGEAAFAAVKKKFDGGESEKFDSMDKKMDALRFKCLEQDAINKELKNEYLKNKIEMQQLKLSQRRMEVEAAEEKRRLERQEWKVALVEKVVVDVSVISVAEACSAAAA